MSESELEQITRIAEEHAHAFRQVAGQRARLFRAFSILGNVAEFKNGSGLSTVVDALIQSQSQFYQDVFAMLLNRGKRNGFFVEFGACDGLLISNTVLLERNFGWGGILAEPSRSWHDALRRNRSCTIETRCVWSSSGDYLEFAEFDNDAYGTQSALLQTSANGSHAATKYNVETITLADMLAEHNAPKVIDFISVDVEGGEYDILKNFPFDQYRFEFMCVEHMTPEQEGRIKSLLTDAGYRQVLRSVSGHDGFYVPERGGSLQGLNASDVDEFWLDWYSDAEITKEFNGEQFPVWAEHLSQLRNAPLNLLEVGASEGSSSIFLLNFFHASHLTAIDTFEAESRDRFDRNTRDHSGRVTKVSGRSSAMLDDMAADGSRSFDLIYLGGSHIRDQVARDSIAAWSLLRVGGIMVWNHYGIKAGQPALARELDPGPAIDTFLKWREGDYETLHKGYQVIVRKTRPHFTEG